MASRGLLSGTCATKDGLISDSEPDLSVGEMPIGVVSLCFQGAYLEDVLLIVALDINISIMSNILVKPKYQDDLAEAEATLKQMLMDADFLETRIAKQKRKIAALRELANITTEAAPQSDLVEGITDACRVVLRAAGRPLLPVEVRDQVEALGVRQENLLASVHTVLKRLLKSNEIAEVFPRSGTGPAAYRWITRGERVLDIFLAMSPQPKESPPELKEKNSRP